MARVSVWVPDELHALMRKELPALNVSRVLQEAIRARLRCQHQLLACRECAAPIDRWGLLDEQLGEFYREFLWRVEPLVNRVGTAEGAARIAKEVAQSFGLSAASLPLPRPSRANRELARDRAFEDAQRSMEQQEPRRRRRTRSEPARREDLH